MQLESRTGCSVCFLAPFETPDGEQANAGTAAGGRCLCVQVVGSKSRSSPIRMQVGKFMKNHDSLIRQCHALL